MLVKPSVTFLTSYSDADLITTTGGIIAGLTNNASYPSPSPTLATVNTALQDFSSAVAAAQGGGVALTSAKNDRRAALVALVRELASYVHVACKGNYTALLTSGFPTQKPNRQPVGALPTPANLVISNGSLSGELDAQVDPVPNALIYNWTLSLASAPDATMQTDQTSASYATFMGLTPGMAYTISANAVGTAGPSEWSTPATQICL